MGFSAPTSSPSRINVVTGNEGALRFAPRPTYPAPQPSGRSSPERIREQAAFTALPCACSFEGAKVPSSVEQALLQAREWMNQVQQREANVAALREASPVGERENVKNHAKLRRVQDILEVVSQRLPAPPMSSSTVGAYRPAPEDASAAPLAKRMRHSYARDPLRVLLPPCSPVGAPSAVNKIGPQPFSPLPSSYARAIIRFVRRSASER